MFNLRVMGLFDRLKAGLAKARDHIRAQLIGPEVDFDTLEHVLLGADFGVPMTQQILRQVRAQAKEKPTLARKNALAIVREEIEKSLASNGAGRNEVGQPRVILVVGVNGTGKTTTIAKLANHFKKAGHTVMVGAADTFRAAAIDQLKIWCDRLKVEMVSGAYGADPSSVAHDAVARARNAGTDVLIIDTAGRLHTKSNLMRELEKMKRVIDKQLPGAPHETWLVIDATTGGNSLLQAKQFHQAVGLTGLILTKLDGTARGGIAVAIQNQLQVPVLFLGVGEQLEDLQPFEPKSFAEALLK
jgi:fused signal recognition particle receptor